MNKFDIDIAIEDDGICARQKIYCAVCPIGKTLGYDADVDQLCNHELVLELSKLVKEFI